MRVLTGSRRSRRPCGSPACCPRCPRSATPPGPTSTTLHQLPQRRLGNPADFRGDDTYWTGKGLGRAARIAEIADQVNTTAVRDSALNAIRTRPDRLVHRVSRARPAGSSTTTATWGTLIGYPASYGSDKELNDHHFHYGYFIAAAATLAKFDPAWAAAGQYGGMVDLLIRDANNYDRNDTRFPYLRDFDIYAGHDWASGHARVRRRQQPGVVVGGHELRQRADPVGPGHRQHRGPRRRHLHLHHAGRGDPGVLVRRRATRTSRPRSGTTRSAWSGATAARTPPGSPASRR